MRETVYFSRKIRLQTDRDPQDTAKPCASATHWFSGKTVTSEAREEAADRPLALQAHQMLATMHARVLAPTISARTTRTRQRISAS